MLRKAIYPKVENHFNKIAETLHQQGFTPNQLTLAGCAVNFLAGCLFAGGHLALGGMVMILAGIGDVLDGPLARVSNNASKFGAFLHASVNRYSDFFIFGGLAVFFAKQSEGLWLLVTLGILLGAFATSYHKASAESLGDPCRGGLFERAERILLLALGVWIPSLFYFVLWVLLLGTHFTAIRKILHIKKVLSEQ